MKNANEHQTFNIQSYMLQEDTIRKTTIYLFFTVCSAVSPLPLHCTFYRQSRATTKIKYENGFTELSTSKHEGFAMNLFIHVTDTTGVCVCCSTDISQPQGLAITLPGGFCHIILIGNIIHSPLPDTYTLVNGSTAVLFSNVDECPRQVEIP